MIRIITVSDRSAAGLREDRSGPKAVELLRPYGEVEGPIVVPDDAVQIAAAITSAVDAGADLVFTTGGTGITPRDVTPEATLPLLAKRLEGLETAMRTNPDVPAAALSRGVAGVVERGSHRAVVVNAPGSTGGVRDAIGVVGPLIPHLIDQLRGADHTVPAEEIGRTPAITTDGLTAHQRATAAIQNRGHNDHRDAEVVIAGISTEPIDVAALRDAVADPAAGAIVVFDGRVRNHDDGHGVTSIDYEAHPEAGAVVARIAREAAAGSGAIKLAIQHRSGHLEVGDVAFAAAASAAHRREAFELLESAVERVKMELPVWKKQEFTDGSHEWTGAA